MKIENNTGFLFALTILILILAQNATAQEKSNQLFFAHRDFPPAGAGLRSSHDMAYSAKLKGVVLFGGFDYPDSLSGTWRWNGKKWKQYKQAKGPDERHWHAMAFDENRNRIVLFGGQHGNGGPWRGDTWELVGRKWRLKSSSGPEPRYGHAMAYDPERRVIVLFGGGTANGYLQDTWTWDGAEWKKVRSKGPPGRVFHAMAFNACAHSLILFGGKDSKEKLLGDTWRWKGKRWKRLKKVGTPPDPRYGARMALDTVNQGLILFGGASDKAPYYFDDTWFWNSAKWEKLEANGAPQARLFHAMAWDGKRKVVILHGGNDVGFRTLGDTWEWDGAGWTQVD